MDASVDDTHLTRRERQIMDVIYARGESSAREILGEIPDPPGYSSVRKLLGILVEKGHLKQRSEGKRLVYSARQGHGRAARGAMQKLLDVFYGGSVEEAVSGLISLKRKDLDSEQLSRLASLIEEAKNATDPPTKP
ncbi:MAG: BlaI/MecI/CopY family transcriptional regulator [Verrucomicrobiales bacterium]